MPRCIRCAIDGDDVTMHNGAWVHRAPGICFKKLRDVVESLQQERTGLRAELDAIKERVETAERDKKFLNDRLEHHLRIQKVCAELQDAAEMRENLANIRARKEAKISRGALIQKEEAIARAETAEKDAATLRAELDAIKGAQDEVTCETRSIYGNVSVKRLVRYVVTAAPIQHLHEWTYETLDDVMRLWPELEDKRAALETLRHPAPALPVVGACVVRDGDVQSDSVICATSNGRNEGYAIGWADRNGGFPHQLLLGAPLPTEGGK